MKTDHHACQTERTPLVIPIFIMNKGCPHRCTFCNQKISAGGFPDEITQEYFDSQVNSYLSHNRNKPRNVEIAFYGGSFTGVDPAYQEKLLSWANRYIESGLVGSVRISTRPDYISKDRVLLLKKYNVTTVEIGAQSFNDHVLQVAQRGHDAAAIVSAVKILKDHGLRTGLHLMAGLPRDSREGFFYSLEKTVELKPDIVRIHPVLVFKGTTLEKEFREGRYRPLELSDAVEMCKTAWQKLSTAGIRIIRIGLQLTPEMEQEGTVLAGPVHPALGHLVLSSVFYDYTIRLLNKISPDAGEIRFHLSERDVSNFRGSNNMNMAAIKKLYPRANIIIESIPGQKRGAISVDTGLSPALTVEVPGLV